MIRPNEIRTTTIAAAIVIIAATTVMISTAVAIRTAIGIKTAIGIRIKTVYQDRDRDRDNDAYYDRDNRAYGRGGSYGRNSQWRGRLSAQDQSRFDSYYSRWLGYRRTNNQSEAESMDRRMRDVYAHYGIPNNVPFNQVASPGAGPIVAY